MRDMFINLLEKLINIIVVIGAIGVVVAAAAMLFMPNNQFGPAGGVLGALLVLVVGAVYLILVAGFMYLGLGIYQNTKRTADLLERR